MSIQFFPQCSESHPMIYAYSDVAYPGCLKAGFTAVDVNKRIGDVKKQSANYAVVICNRL